MYIQKLILNFYKGKIKLWKSFWLIGLGHSIFLLFFIPKFEIAIFNNSNIYSLVYINQDTIQLPDFTKLSFLSKLIVILSTIYITVGIWRSCESYNGNLFWIVVTFFYLSFNNILPIFYLILTLFF